MSGGPCKSSVTTNLPAEYTEFTATCEKIEGHTAKHESHRTVMSVAKPGKKPTEVTILVRWE